MRSLVSRTAIQFNCSRTPDFTRFDQISVDARLNESLSAIESTSSKPELSSYDHIEQLYRSIISIQLYEAVNIIVAKKVESSETKSRGSESIRKRPPQFEQLITV